MAVNIGVLRNDWATPAPAGTNTRPIARLKPTKVVSVGSSAKPTIAARAAVRKVPISENHGCRIGLLASRGERNLSADCRKGYGEGAITFAAMAPFCSPREQAYPAAMSFTIGTFLTAALAAIVGFALLPTLTTFVGFSLAIGPCCR